MSISESSAGTAGCAPPQLPASFVSTAGCGTPLIDSLADDICSEVKNLGSFLVEEFARAEMVTIGYNMDDTGGDNDNDKDN